MKMDERQAKREAARLKLRERYLKERAARGQRRSSPNAKVPVGQVETRKWPVLDLGTHPEVKHDDWRLRVDGAVTHPMVYSWSEFMSLDQLEDVSDFHCVTTWSKLDMSWVGVPFWCLVDIVKPKSNCTVRALPWLRWLYDQLEPEAALEPDVLLVHTFDGAFDARTRWSLSNDYAKIVCMEGHQVDQSH